MGHMGYTVNVRWIALAMALACSAASSAAAQDEHRLRWDGDWSRVHPAAYPIMTTAVAGSLVFEAFYHESPDALLYGPILFDEPFRQRLRAADFEDRERAALASDVLLGVLLAWPFIDSLGVVGLGDMNSDVSWQLSMIAVESYAADYVINTLFKVLVHRDRPHGDRCTLLDRALNPGRCGTRGRTRSFYSGHTSAAFNAAGVVCITHAHLPIYGSTAADAFACGAAMVTASMVGILRVIADRHHISDVLIGSVVGLLTGILLPWGLHFAWDPVPGDEATVRMDPLRATHLPLMAGAF